jgi:hypothetical protein
MNDPHVLTSSDELLFIMTQSPFLYYKMRYLNREVNHTATSSSKRGPYPRAGIPSGLHAG